jgi:four helix bundle protein
VIYDNLMPSPQELRDRTKAFAVRIVRLYRSLPYRTDAQVLGKQLIRSGTAVAANYRAACRARSKAEWVAKIGVVVEEADETLFWLEMLMDCEIVAPGKLQALIKEGHELSAIFTASRHTARST